VSDTERDRGSASRLPRATGATLAGWRSFRWRSRALGCLGRAR
jgi:hypothetical protein